MGKLYLIRHGQANFGATSSAGYDKLSELGYQQSLWCGEYLKSLGLTFDKVACGTLERHKSTLEGLAESGLVQGADMLLPGLNEYDGHGLLKAWFAIHGGDEAVITDRRSHFRTLRQAYNAWSHNELADEKLESWQQFTGRILEAINQITHKNDGKNILLVSSGGVISWFISHILNAPPAAAMELNLQTFNTGISEIVVTSSKYFVIKFNQTPHLDTPDRKNYLTQA